MPKEEAPIESADLKMLKELGVPISKDGMFKDAYITKFKYEGGAQVTIRIKLHYLPEVGLVITNMTTLPETETGKGFGSKAVQSILDWAKVKGMKEIRAVQVLKESEKFWIKNGFIKMEGENITNDYTLKLN